MTDVLRSAAKKLKSASSQSFYSMREVAVFFHAPLGTISLVYKALEREGILNRIRSSRTMLVGKKVFPREAVRGVVGIPIWLHSIVLMVYTRTLAMEIEEHLHYKTEVDTFQSILNRQGLEIERVQDTPSQLLKRVRQNTSKSSPAVAFLDSTHSEEVCNCEPQIIEQISQISRLAFCVGSIRVPYLHFRKVRADLIDFCPKEIASRLADDICRLPVLPDGICHTFVAHYYEQMSL
jgi:hypothetical protein